MSLDKTIEKFDAVNSKMNRITKELMKNVDMSEEMLTSTEEISEILSSISSKNTSQLIQAPKKPKIVEAVADSEVSEEPKIVNDYDSQNPQKSVQILDHEITIINEDQNTSDLTIREMASTIVDVELMREDFEYMRQNLRETTENTRRVLGSVTEELILAEGESRAGLLVAFSELNKAQLEGMKLFMLSYKEISTILVNFSKVYKESQPTTNQTTYTTNVLNIEPSSMSAADIIGRLRKTDE